MSGSSAVARRAGYESITAWADPERLFSVQAPRAGAAK
jgi:hypothetical protein